MPHTTDALRALVEDHLAGLDLTAELGTLEESMRYALDGGGKRIRPVLCLAVGEVVGAAPDTLLPAAAAVELVHSFSLVHDDLPALDDDAVRRGRPSTWAAHGEATAILAGDALLAEAVLLALSYPSPEVARELVRATAAMIGGQQLDLAGTDDLAGLHRLKTGALFRAAVLCALWAAGVPEGDHEPWREFAGEVGLLFQIVDDILDGDGYVASIGADGAQALAEATTARARAALTSIAGDTHVLAGIVAELASRTA